MHKKLPCRRYIFHLQFRNSKERFHEFKGGNRYKVIIEYTEKHKEVNQMKIQKLMIVLIILVMAVCISACSKSGSSEGCNCKDSVCMKDGMCTEECKCPDMKDGKCPDDCMCMKDMDMDKDKDMDSDDMKDKDMDDDKDMS